MENEIWKDVAIEPWGEMYEVSNLGRVRSKVRTYTRIHPITGKSTEFRAKSGLMKPNLTPKGYLRVTLGKNGNKFLVHRLIMITFGSVPIDEKMQVNHRDGNKANNHIDNLEWVTNKENIIHAYKNNLIKVPRGEHNATAKRVLQLHIQTGEVIKEWACLSYIKRDLNYQISSISNVCHGKKKSAHGFKWQYV